MYAIISLMVIILLLLQLIHSISSSNFGGSSNIFNPYSTSIDKLVPTSENSQNENNKIDSHLLPLPLNDLQYHGTTTLAYLFKDSVIVAVDSMASVGSYVGSRTVRKVFPVSDRVIATMAGGAADCAYWIRNMAAQVKCLEYQCGSPLQTKVYAKVLASSMREYRGKDLSLGTMVAGWHLETGPELYYVDSSGVCVGPGRCFSVGSGSSLAYSVVDDAWSKLQASGSLDDAIELATWAVKHSTHRDSYSGGFINVFKIDKTGCHHLKRIDSRSLRIKQ